MKCESADRLSQIWGVGGNGSCTRGDLSRRELGGVVDTSRRMEGRGEDGETGGSSLPFHTEGKRKGDTSTGEYEGERN